MDCVGFELCREAGRRLRVGTGSGKKVKGKAKTAEPRS
ncbi:hypothetical protein CEXT_418441, partial [Caerostris extrusa]